MSGGAAIWQEWHRIAKPATLQPSAQDNIYLKSRKEFFMKKFIVPFAVLALVASPAFAKGRLKGAAVGATAGHFVGHGHAKAGAVAGAVAGHHHAKMKARTAH